MSPALWSILKFCNHGTTQIIVLTVSQPLVDTMVDVCNKKCCHRRWGGFQPIFSLHAWMVTTKCTTATGETKAQFPVWFHKATYKTDWWVITSCENHTTFIQMYKWSTLVFLRNKSGLSCSKDGQNNPVHKYCPNRLSYPFRKALTIHGSHNWNQHFKHNKQASSVTCSWWNIIIICSNNSCWRSQCFWVYALFCQEIISIMQLKRPFSECFLVFQRSQILFLLLEWHSK